MRRALILDSNVDGGIRSFRGRRFAQKPKLINGVSVSPVIVPPRSTLTSRGHGSALRSRRRSGSLARRCVVVHDQPRAPLAGARAAPFELRAP